jgi:hypothetical protein
MKKLVLIFVLALSVMTDVAAAGFADQGFVRGAIRTEYENGIGAGNSWLTLNYTLGGQEGCLWNGNPANNFGCPGRAPTPSNPTPWLGVL